MSYQVLYPPQEVLVVSKPQISGWSIFMFILVFFIIVIVILVLVFVIRCSFSSGKAVVDNSNYSNFTVKETPVMGMMASKSVINFENYIAIEGELNDTPTVPIDSSVSKIENVSLQACLDSCSSYIDCKGVWYNDNQCSLLDDIPSLKGDSTTPSLYLKQHYDPKIIDKVFIGNANTKLVDKEWWSIKEHDISGNINVFSLNKVKTWYLSSGQHDIINSGRLTGIFSTHELSIEQIDSLLKKDIHPKGITCVVDTPDKDIYQLNLSIFGRKTIYVSYIKP